MDKVKVKIKKDFEDMLGISFIAGSELYMSINEYEKYKGEHPDALELIDKEQVFKPLQVKLEYGEFFNYNEQYHISFEYSNEYQKGLVNEFFSNLIPTYGMNGSRHVNEGKDAIMPYKEGNTFSGTSIPEDLLVPIIKKLIEVDGAVIKVGNITINGEIEDELLDTIVHSIKKEKGLKK